MQDSYLHREVNSAKRPVWAQISCRMCVNTWLLLIATKLWRLQGKTRNCMLVPMALFLKLYSFVCNIIKVSLIFWKSKNRIRCRYFGHSSDVRASLLSVSVVSTCAKVARHYYVTLWHSEQHVILTHPSARFLYCRWDVQSITQQCEQSFLELAYWWKRIWGFLRDDVKSGLNVHQPVI